MLSEVRDLSLRDRLLAMRSLESLRHLEDETLSLIAEHARFRSFRRGELLLEEGKRPAKLIVVLEGEVRVERLGHLIAMVERSGGVGFVSVLARDDVGVTATALKDTACLEIPATAFLRALEEDFALVRNGLRLSAGQLVRTRGELPADPDEERVVETGEFREREMTMVERIIQMRNGPVFSRCNLDAVIELVRRSREVRIKKGTELFARGDESTYSLAIDYGILRCTAESGRHVDIGCGFVVGVMDSFAQTQRSFNAVAQTDVVGHRVELAVFMSVLETHFDLAMDLQAGISSQLLRGN